MESNNKTFWELITSYKINIPIIQRDYAQGRREEFEKRNRFLHSLFDALTQNKILDLDFVYGRIDDKVFFPIDGQQRLTTLFLLHWYLSLRENIENITRQCLSKFVYDTRISSREFCKCLISEKIQLPLVIGNNELVDQIKDKHWFRKSWESDPTIDAMLTMIQAIHDKFYTIEDLSNWDKIVSKRLITFQILDLGAKGFELTDELYIKMNARGKQLTPFENFKANFIQFIDKNFKDSILQHPIKGSISYSGYFSYKIEKEWTDLFWAFRGDKATIDVEITNYFEFVAQMCFYKLNRNAKAEDFKNSFSQYEVIFKKEEHLLFLFDSLDKLYEISASAGVVGKKNIDLFFESFLNTQSQNDGSKVTLFWISSGSSNLFERIIRSINSEDARTKIIFYCIIQYLLKHNFSNEIGLQRYSRVIRNLIQATRQRNETKYNTNIRLNVFGSYWLLFEQLATEDPYYLLQHGAVDSRNSQIAEVSLRNEKEKAEMLLTNSLVADIQFGLEEFKYFEGLIHILKPRQYHGRFNDYLRALTEIWDDSISDTLRIQALIACGFEGLQIRETRMGPTYYFGKKGNWSTILTNEEIAVSESVISLLELYLIQEGKTAENRLKAIIGDWLVENPTNETWKYYFLRYNPFTSQRNYYVWPDDYELSILGTEGSNPLVAYHISPYVLTVCKLINDKQICDETDCYIQYTGNSSLALKNGISLKCLSNGWQVSGKFEKLDSSLISKFSLSPIDHGFLLEEKDGLDRIETAVEFIKALQY